jgi:hypothetical protein
MFVLMDGLGIICCYLLNLMGNRWDTLSRYALWGMMR